MKRLFLILVLCLPLFVHAQIVETIVGNGTAGYIGDNGPADLAELSIPISVKFDHSGNLYIVDQGNNVIRKLNESGIITTVVGNGIAGYIGDGGPATDAEINSPNDIAFDEVGNLYIADWVNEVIRKVDIYGVITTFAGTGIYGYNGDGIPATSAQINEPLGLAFDTAGTLYFSDNINHRVRKINTAGLIYTVAGNGTAGFNGDGGAADSAEIRLPAFIAIGGPTKGLYITDYLNHRIREVNTSGIINTVAGNGVTEYTDGGLADTSSLEFPWCIVFDNTGNYYITDIANGTIHKVDTTGIINTIAGNGTAGYSGDGGTARDAEFGSRAACTAVDALGNLYIADYSNNRIRRIVYTPTNIYTAAHNVTKPPTQVIVYPNPAIKAITVCANVPLDDVVIEDVLGRVVEHYSFSTQKATIDVAGLPSGIYFLKVNGIEVKKFVKE